MADMTARGARPSAAIRDQYQQGLTALISEMVNSVEYWLTARYTAREDEIVAQDASPTRDLEKELRELMKQWGSRFDDYATQRAKWFARRVNTNTTNQLKGALKDAGLTVAFRNSRRVNNIYKSVIANNVNLIRTIPQQFLGNVNTIVMQSIRNGRDMGFIAKQVREQYGVTKNRAITIARDQTNKATEAVSNARCADIGIEYGIWMHRSGSKVPRSSHVKMNGKRFKLSEGLYDDDPKVNRKVKPAELINCHCTFRLDLSTITGEGIAMDSRRGITYIHFPAATIEWRMAA